MNTRNSKARREEKFQLLRFLQTKNIVRFGDRPDLILDIGQQKIAIEHTRIIRDRTKEGSLERQRESIKDQIVEEAKALYVVEKHYSFCLNVSFNPIVHIAQKQVSPLAQQLCDCVRELETFVIAGCSGLFDWRSNLTLTNKIPDAIAHFWIDRASYENDLWSVSDGGAVGSLEPDFIQFALDDKENKLSSYREKCDQVWILVVASGFKMSSYFDRDDSQFLEAHYVSSADEIYLLDDFANKVHKLNIIP